ncbi:hypothetical protein [Mesorhizobium mediterraneum]|uniref:hypothetical protein n=1 Tax=Mesorhizobium mediterraneum TaxID=43617 RepID=UPI0017847345|nr:hypothetical protein [Mesorhizobium mediterraneum]
MNDERAAARTRSLAQRQTFLIGAGQWLSVASIKETSGTITSAARRPQSSLPCRKSDKVVSVNMQERHLQPALFSHGRSATGVLLQRAVEAT